MFDIFKTKPAPSSGRDAITAHRAASLKLADELFSAIFDTAALSPGDVLIPFNTSYLQPFTARVLSAEGRNVRLAFGICMHPGLGKCLIAVPSVGASWLSVREDCKAAMKTKDGHFKFDERFVTFHPLADLHPSTAVDFADCMLRALGTDRLFKAQLKDRS